MRIKLSREERKDLIMTTRAAIKKLAEKPDPDRSYFLWFSVNTGHFGFSDKAFYTTQIGFIDIFSIKVYEAGGKLRAYVEPWNNTISGPEITAAINMAKNMKI